MNKKLINYWKNIGNVVKEFELAASKIDFEVIPSMEGLEKNEYQNLAAAISRHYLGDIKELRKNAKDGEQVKYWQNSENLFNAMKNFVRKYM